MFMVKFMHRKPSRFLAVKCNACENEQIIYSHAKTDILCTVCNNKLIELTGSRVNFSGVTVLTVLS